MIQTHPHAQIFLAIDPIDFRNGIDGLARLCHDIFRRDPQNGSIFLFRNRAQTSIKILMYDGQGYWLCLKRLSKGSFKWWPRAGSIEQKHLQLAANDLAILLWNGQPSTCGEIWRKVEPTAPYSVKNEAPGQSEQRTVSRGAHLSREGRIAQEAQET